MKRLLNVVLAIVFILNAGLALAAKSEETPLDAFVRDYQSQNSWGDKLKVIKQVRDECDEKYRKDEWDGKSNWECPLPYGTIIMDSGITEENLGAGLYNEFALESVTECNISSNTTIDDDVLVTGANCVWKQATININGNLTVSSLGNLTIQTYSILGYVYSVTVNVAGNVYVSNNINFIASNSGANVNFNVGGGKTIYVYSAGKLEVTATTSNSTVHFSNISGDTGWNGIEGQRGSDIIISGARIAGLFGTYSYTVLFDEIAGYKQAIKHMGGSSSYYGKLEITGAKFNEVPMGVYVTGGSTSTIQYYSTNIVFQDSNFYGNGQPIYIYNILTNVGKDLYIEDNTIRLFGFYSGYHGIKLYNTRIDGRILIRYNKIDDGDDSDSRWAIYLENVYHGDDSSGNCQPEACSWDHILIRKNLIGQTYGVSNGIFVRNWRTIDGLSNTEARCDLQINADSDGSGDIKAINEGIHIEHGYDQYNNSVGVSSCIGDDREDWLEIRGIAIEADNPYPSDAVYGIYLDDFKDTSINSGLIDSMLVAGFVNEIYLGTDITGQVEITTSNFAFAGNTAANRAMIRMENSSNAEITIGTSNGLNCYEATNQTYGHINGNDGAGENSTCGYGDFNGQVAGPGNQMVYTGIKSTNDFGCTAVTLTDGCEI